MVAIGARFNYCNYFAHSGVIMPFKPQIFKFSSRPYASEALVSALSAAINNGIKEKNFANIALSGGSTPEPIYQELAGQDIDFSKVNIALVDERWVDINHEASNEAMIRRAFKNANGINIISMKTNDETPAIGAQNLEQIYKNLRPFDAIVLGMGNDAHTASWFSGAIGLDEILSGDNTHTLAAIDASHSEVGGKYPQRITLTLPPIAETQMLLLLIFGQDKLEVFERSVTGDARLKPIKAAIDSASHGLVVFWAP
jgi:6-phosphogluconolactonase